MTVSVDAVINNVKTVLNDSGLVHWSRAELLSWISECRYELVKLKPDAATKTSTVQLVAGAKQPNPAGCVEIIDVRQNSGGGAVTRCSRDALDLFSPNWMYTPTASYVRHWMDDQHPEYFYVYPAQSQTPATVTVTYSFIPSEPVVGGALEIRDIYQADVENYVLYRAFSKDAEQASAERAVAYYKAFYR